MKKDIHPPYYTANVTCSCGNNFEVGATVKEIHVEICSVCHPFYTGTQKLIDTAGRVERFQERLAKAKVKTEAGLSVGRQRQGKSEKQESNKDKLKEIKKTLVN